MRNIETTIPRFGIISAGRKQIGRFLRRAGLATTALLAGFSTSAMAQQPQIVNHGQVVVTGYSGSEAFAPPEGDDPFDYFKIKLDGPSARIVDVRVLGPQGQASNVVKPFSVTAAQVGQVFGVTLDNALRPNIYVAATSTYGLAIGVADTQGQQKRVRKGQPGAHWLAGQFGPAALGGGPGSIWRIDGTTGAVSLFANVEVAAFGAASLGGLAFDPVTRQIFAADRGTGLVHRFSLDGVQRGTYDHGTEGRAPAGLPPILPPGFSPININSPAFDTENPATWGFAAPARRVFGLAVRNSRLYYSIGQGPQIWSVGISPSGAVAASPRIEVEVPSLQEGVEISSITFDGQGRMYLAERGATTGDYFRYALANGSASRVLRFVRQLPGDPAPGLWRLVPEQYSVGMTPPHANTNGGIALGYGYNQENVINFASCGTTLWSTGERLLDPGNPDIPPDSYPGIDGLQGNFTNLVQPQNTPPLQSWFIDYDDLGGDPNFRGHMGAIATLPCLGQPAVLPPPPPVSCPPGTYFSNGQCIIIPTCPPDTHYENGQCVYDSCPPGTYLNNGQCVPPPVVCPPGNFYYQGQCIPLACPPGLIKAPNGQCVCPPGNVYFNGQCVPPNACPPGMVELPGGICWCPLGTIFGDGFCQPNVCPPDQVMENGFCQPCPDGEVVENGVCVEEPCPPGEEKWDGQCVPKCPPFQFRKPDGTCGNFQLCLPPKEIWQGQCVPKCPPGEFHLPPNGACGDLGILPPLPVPPGPFPPLPPVVNPPLPVPPGPFPPLPPVVNPPLPVPPGPFPPLPPVVNPPLPVPPGPFPPLPPVVNPPLPVPPGPFPPLPPVVNPPLPVPPGPVPPGPIPPVFNPGGILPGILQPGLLNPQLPDPPSEEPPGPVGPQIILPGLLKVPGVEVVPGPEDLAEPETETPVVPQLQLILPAVKPPIQGLP